MKFKILIGMIFCLIISIPIAINAENILKIYDCKYGVCYETILNKKNILIRNDSTNPKNLLSFSVKPYNNEKRVSKRKSWVILTVIIGHEGPGRIEEFNVLYFVKLKKIVNPRKLNGPPLRFVFDKKAEYVEFFENKILLSDLEKKSIFIDLKEFFKF